MFRFLFILLFSLSSQTAFAQTIEEDFSFNTFSSSIWKGDTLSWKTTGAGIQSTNNIVNASFVITTPIQNLPQMEWFAELELRFSTSSANYVDWWLNASENDISKANGYFVRIGGTDDEISLFYKNPQGTITKVIDGINGRSQYSSSKNRLQLKLTLVNNVFQLSSKQEANTWVNEGNYAANNVNTGVIMAWFVKQSTASFFGKHSIITCTAKEYVADTKPAFVQSYYFIDNKHIVLKYSEPVNASSTQFKFNKTNVLSVQTNQDSCIIHIDNNSLDDFEDTLLINNLSDLSGNDTSFKIKLLNHFIKQGDILFNEILSDPITGGYDYIELYNNSQYPIEINKLKIQNSKNEFLRLDSSLVLQSNQFVCLTENSDWVKLNYAKAVNIVQVKALPSMNNDEGTLFIKFGDMMIDSLTYSSSMHNAALDKTESYALEKVEKHKLSFQTNWLSAASHYKGTPGFENSQSLNLQQNTGISLSNNVVSPNNDARHDFVNINISGDYQGAQCRINIYSLSGIVKNKLVTNTILGTDNSFIWDGSDENNELLPQGNYIILTEIVKPNAEVIQQKLVVGVWY